MLRWPFIDIHRAGGVDERGSFLATSFCQEFKDMPTPSRGHGTQRLLRRGEFAPGLPFAYVADPDGYEIEIWFE
jgi:catechol 2,3-dioxygenase-like lactoylglutathione lyase family enzyme